MSTSLASQVRDVRGNRQDLQLKCGKTVPSAAAPAIRQASGYTVQIVWKLQQRVN